MASENIEVILICEVLRVSRSGYYSWLKRPISERKSENDKLTLEIRKIHKQSRETYGAPRIQAKLRNEGKRHGKARIARIMKREGLQGVAKKKYRVKTTDSEHNLPIAERIFQTEIASSQVTRPNQFWASDITYVPTDEGWLYLAVFLDLFTRKAVGFSMAEHLRTELVLNALDMALGRQNLLEGDELVSHSDRGCQYAAAAYRQRLDELGMTVSHSRRANCYDNAFAESFFHTLKVELVHRRRFKTRKEAMAAIFEYIEVWYNRQRLHSSLGYRTPIDYEHSALAA
jgi:transposase InsO family protein